MKIIQIESTQQLYCLDKKKKHKALNEEEKLKLNMLRVFRN